MLYLRVGGEKKDEKWEVSKHVFYATRKLILPRGII